jgi:ribose/xylose/arabinose/galactoside ABC-type transport system permease subunit
MKNNNFVTVWKKINRHRNNLTQYLSFISIIILIVFFSSINPNFFGTQNINNILMDISPLLLMSCGVAFALMLGSIDLSIGSIASCAAVMLTVLMSKIGVTAYLIVIIFGIFAGLLNGLLHTFLKVPSFIATLSTQCIWQSAAFIISGGMPLAMLPDTWPYVNWAKVSIGFVPIMFLIGLAVMLIYFIIQSRTNVGRTMLAVGANEKAARLIGLNVIKAKIYAFVFSGLGAALGGIFFAAKLKSGIPTVGEQYALMAIASAVLGGVALTGGKGNILMTLLGVCLITTIQNGMNVISVNGMWQQIVFGILVLCAIYLNSNRTHKDMVVK